MLGDTSEPPLSFLAVVRFGNAAAGGGYHVGACVGSRDDDIARINGLTRGNTTTILMLPAVMHYWLPSLIAFEREHLRRIALATSSSAGPRSFFGPRSRMPEPSFS